MTRFRLIPALLTALGALATLAVADVPVPTLEGPIGSPGSAFLQGTTFALAPAYTDDEYFVSGTASAYTNVGPLGGDGKWTVVPSGVTAPYKTRIVVRRPTNPRKFNGTVVIEWLNVSGGLDAAPDWILAHTELMRDGFAWIGVSAQYVGVEGGPGLVSIISLPLKQVDPTRYGSLHHPGDTFSYDIYAQVAQAVRHPGSPSPLGDLKVRRVIAAGESQSAFRMVTFVNALHPLLHLHDGFFVHSRSGLIGAALSEAPQPAIPVPGSAPIREDLDVPVLTLETDTDMTFLSYGPARQPDTRTFRAWEVAGTAHADIYTVRTGMGDRGDSPDVVGLTITSTPIPGIIMCAQPLNSGPHHFVVNAAFSALNHWIKTGRPPKSQPPLELDSAGSALLLDANGNARGGVRTPQVDVPIATFSGEQAGSILCRLFGTTTPFDAPKLLSLYPTHRAFVSAYNRAVGRAIKSGAVLKADARLMRKWALGAAIPH